jgi:hypothetical protein
MCIMEIHEHARNATMLQALAHNASTWDRDADMLVPVLRSRGRDDLARQVEAAQAKVHEAYASCLEMFAELCAESVTDQDGRYHAGSERTLEDIITAATRAARRDESR